MHDQPTTAKRALAKNRGNRWQLSHQKRNRLLARGADILAHDGLSGLNLRHLADLANTSTMAVYSHFGDKKGFLNALYLKTLKDVATILDQVPLPIPQAERLQIQAKAFLNYCQTAPGNCLILAANPALRGADNPIDRNVHRMQRAIISSIEASVNVGRSAPREDSRNIALGFWAAWMGTVSLSLRGAFISDGFDCLSDDSGGDGIRDLIIRLTDNLIAANLDAEYPLKVIEGAKQII